MPLQLLRTIQNASQGEGEIIDNAMNTFQQEQNSSFKKSRGQLKFCYNKVINHHRQKTPDHSLHKHNSSLGKNRLLTIKKKSGLERNNSFMGINNNAITPVLDKEAEENKIEIKRATV